MRLFNFSVCALLAFTVGACADSTPFSIANQARAKLGSHLPVKILCMGDSMSDVGYNYPSISRAFMIRMRDAYGDGGQGLDGWDIGGSHSVFGRNVPPGFFFGVSATIYPGDQVSCVQEGAQYYLNGNGWVPTNSYNRAGLFWYSHPGGGLFTVGITNLRTQAVELPGTVLNGYSETPEIRYTNWPVLASGHLVLRVTGLTATNYLIGPELARTDSGVEVFFFARGGVSLSQQLSLGTNLLSQLWGAVSPDLVIYHAKDYGPPPDSQDTNLISANLLIMLSSLTNFTTNIVIVGTPPGDPKSGQNAVLQNGTEKRVAEANGFGYVDLFSDFPDFSRNQTAGMTLDFIHPSALGASIWADELAYQLGFDKAVVSPRPVLQAVDIERTGTVTLSWSATPSQTYQLQSKTDLGGAWRDFGASVTATNSTLTTSDSETNGTSYRFYRLRFSP